MRCPECQFDNREGVRFCEECGAKFEIECPACGANIPLGRKFCGECGFKLKPAIKNSRQEPGTESPASHPAAGTPSSTVAPPIEGERKHVTALFSDLTGYTVLSEKLDPEEVKEITSRIFSEISKIIAKYDGFIEKYAGDAVMAVFGIPIAHEDDPIRAVKAAREIHELVDAASPEIESRIGQPISMHSGINTGLVVTGEMSVERGTHGVAGDTINLASRLSSLAKSGEILIDVDTCRQAEGQFRCEFVEETIVKGKEDPVQVHRVISQREQPVTIHRLSGLKADLVGRRVELAELAETVEQLRNGKGRIFSIYGAAGTGKSRLVEEFKATLDFEEIQWLEGHAYAYSQNIPYFPLIDLLNRIFSIEENDSPEEVREKVESGIEDLVGAQKDIVPYVGGLYSLSYPEVEDVSPEFWKTSLQSAIKTILSALAAKAPTIFFLEDLHWADPSFVELLRSACLEIRQPAIVLCVYRPTFNLFTGHQANDIDQTYSEIHLQDLSASEAHDMLESLLKTESLPGDLKRLVKGKAGGNPFYLEEMANSLIESEKLTLDDGAWKIASPLTESDLSTSIHGLISGRLDRLQKETKRILQEASVIGSAFLYEILKRITKLEDHMDRGLKTLERRDLIRARSLQPDLEYMFKHPLTQEVVYNGLLKKDRREIHEQIGLVMESIFQDRLSEFYETLAFHFKQGRSVHKAVDYLIRSGEKSLARYGVDESHQYFKEAFDLLSKKAERTDDEDALLVELLIKWSLVYYYRGAFRQQVYLLSAHIELAESLDDSALLGMFYAWYGWSLFFREKYRDSYVYLLQALELGEKTEDQKVIGYACTWLSWTCAELGTLDEALLFGERAQEICQHYPSDRYLFLKSLGGIGYASYFMGNRKRALEVGNTLLEYGQRHSNVRSTVLGYSMIGLGHYGGGELPSAIESLSKGVQCAQDPFYYQFSMGFLGGGYFMNGQLKEAETALKEVASYSRDFGCEILGTPTHAILGCIALAKGRMAQGLRMLEDALRICRANQRKVRVASMEHAMGRIYLQLVAKSGKASLTSITKNIGFILKNRPLAEKNAVAHFNRSLEFAKEAGAKGIEGQAYFDLGRLHRARGRKEQARDFITRAARIFRDCEADIYLEQAYEALDSL